MAIGQHYVEGGLRAADAAPQGEKIVAGLQVGRRGRVVGADGVELPGFQGSPQLILDSFRTQRRRTFERRPGGLHICARKVQVMRAGFAGHVGAARAGLNHQTHGGAAAEVDQVQRRAQLLGVQQGTLHRLQLGQHRAAVQVLTDAVGAPPPGLLSKVTGQRQALGVQGQRQSQAPSRTQSIVERGVVHGGELIQATVAHEGLEADHPGLCQCVHLIQVQRGQTAPQPEVEPRPGGGQLTLGFKTLAVQQRRRGIERHVEETGRPARRQRPRTGFKTLPVAAARLVEVNVGIEDAGKDVQAPGVQFAQSRAQNLVGQFADLPAIDGEIGAALTCGGDERAASHHQLRCHGSPPGPPAVPETAGRPPGPRPRLLPARPRRGDGSARPASARTAWRQASAGPGSWRRGPHR